MSFFGNFKSVTIFTHMPNTTWFIISFQVLTNCISTFILYLSNRPTLTYNNFNFEKFDLFLDFLKN